MKDTFEELYNLTKIDRVKSPWSRRISFEGRLEELKQEVEEAIEAHKSGDIEHIKSELGDVFWDLTFLIMMAEEQKWFTYKEVMENMLEKYKRRKPWVFGTEEITIEEEEKRWAEAKKLEKQNNIK